MKTITIRRKLGSLLVLCSILAILLIVLFVNITVNNKFNQYIKDNQDKKYEKIITYFQDIYKTQGKWTENSGVELMHEAYMDNYCLTLLDSNKKVVWGMDPNDDNYRVHLNSMITKDKGVYNTKTFEIKADNKVVGYVEIGQYSSVLLTEEDVNFKTSINNSIIASSVLTLIITIAISLYFSKRLAVPISEAADMSLRLSKGDFDTKSSTKSDIKEIETLRESVNILAEKLKHQDILRKRLVADISHEIRTPLNVLQNNLEAMIDGIFPMSADRLNSLNEEVIRFGKLLNNLNTLKEFETEAINLNLETVDLNELIKVIYKDFHNIAVSKGQLVNCNIQAGEDFRIIGDKDKLKQVFINLISNAIKFNKPNGEIDISLYADSKNIIIEIQDTGIGINKEDVPFIFERLYRGDKSRHETEGSGIGLTIAKNILQLHSASIEVDSQEGQGTIFKISFIKPLF